jgi:hypothetical protein
MRSVYVMYQIYMLKSKGKYKYHTRALSFLDYLRWAALPSPSFSGNCHKLYIASRPLPSLRAAEQPLASTLLYAVRNAYHSTKHRPSHPSPLARQDRTPCWVGSLRPSASVVIPHWTPVLDQLSWFLCSFISSNIW